MSGANDLDQTDANEEQLYKAQRMHVDVLLDMSEKEFLKEMEPHEYHCYSGWEEAVRGWDRVAPVSGILLPQRRDKKQKPRKETTDNPSSSHQDTVFYGDILASGGEQCGESQSQPGPHNLKKSTLTQKATTEAESPEWHGLHGVEEDSNMLHDEKGQPIGVPLNLQHLPQTMSKARPSKSTKRQARSTVVPITNFTFLPPIK
ncbi:uncharacterized protein LOC130916833 [Corythoichthys intestinalis]|uniref:uncharacterized protein LOC130916833 n=1 Tax=Corythoichthys intestinalis TaxID=161448 RepID=UPI0025A5B52F|nr:uncharacterized protein LOC130916833 [Corythoichthys intestinalis]